MPTTARRMLQISRTRRAVRSATRWNTVGDNRQIVDAMALVKATR